MKTVVTDDMVIRAMAKLHKYSPSPPDLVRDALHAAMNEPEKPQIDVTPEMLTAAYNIAANVHIDGSPLSRGVLARMYRAMRALEPKPVPPFLQCHDCKSTHIVEYGGIGQRAHSRAGDPALAGKTVPVLHRRSTD